MKQALIVSFAVMSMVASTGHAQEACKMEQLSPAGLSLGDMYTKALARAKAWKADVVTARVTNTSMGPLDEQGRSEAWNLMFFSPSANAQVAISTFRGMFTCYAMPGPPGRLPALKADFFHDGTRLYALAKQHGANYIAQGYAVSIDTAAAPGTNHATWYISFSKPDGSTAKLTVIVDANTGAVEKVLRD
jgi:hypothetical protein